MSNEWEDERPDIHDNRELHKMAMESYFMYFKNDLDYEVDKIVKKLIEERDGHYDHASTFAKMQKEEPERFMALADQTGHSPEELISQADMAAMDAVYVEDELDAFAEVQIIYAYKLTEIHIKRLLEIGYGIKNTRQLFQWKALYQFLKDKNIDLKSVKGYKEINELRLVNNAVKHSDAPNENEFNDIPELKGKKYLDSASLRSFYARVKSIPMQFLSSLGGEICDERYAFSDERVNALGEELASRMDKQVADKFVERLQSWYK